MIKKAHLFVVSAPSGAGKTTLCEQLIDVMPDMVRSISMTTRQIRPGEINGRDYFFVSEKKFKDKLKKGGFLEYAKVFDNCYGTPRDFVEKKLSQQKDVLLNIDVQGAMQIKKRFRKNCTLIFILPPSLDDLKKRLSLRRTDTKTQIRKRLEVARKELSFLKHYDHQIINDDIDLAFKKLSAIIVAQHCKIK